MGDKAEEGQRRKDEIQLIVDKDGEEGKNLTGAERWEKALDDCDRRCRLPFQDRAKTYYEHPILQNGVAVVIITNFAVSALQAEIGNEDNKPVFEKFELVFNSLFLCELILNFYANFLFAFWSDRWNNFDFLIVGAAWLSYVVNKKTAEILKIFRPFRVFRLCRRIEALRTIMIGIVKSLPGVINACILLFLIMGIWSIMGVEFFGRKVTPDGQNLPGEFAREFGHFTRALVSMYQISTFDSWSSGISRPIILYYSGTPFVFFIAYSFAASIIMLNVIVAILLDNFIAAAQEVEKSAEDAKREARAKKVREKIAVKLQRQGRVWMLRRAIRKRIAATREKQTKAVTRIQKCARRYLAKLRRRNALNKSNKIPFEDRVPQDDEEAEILEMCERVSRLQRMSELWYEGTVRKLVVLVRALEEHGALPIRRSQVGAEPAGLHPVIGASGQAAARPRGLLPAPCR